MFNRLYSFFLNFVQVHFIYVLKLFIFIFKYCFCCFALCVFVQNHVIYSFKRQTADMRLSELHALREILNRLPTGCSQYACGLVDIFRRYRYACIKINTNACWEPVFGRLLHETADTHCIRPIMVHERMVTSIHFILLHIYRFTLSRYDKRSWSDQRMAEIKALLGLKNQGNVIAHGLYDPYKM